MKVRQFIMALHKTCKFMSIEVSKGEAKIASGSEITRWINQGAVLINGKRVSAEEEISFPIESLILFPNSQKRRTTIK